ncbi:MULTISPECIES: amidohydrolase family protein [Actinoplanes]|uniref:amidohydrolase family protein n=1 Tax=Actinoplanes TaxID=1865 RepID=UPI0005F28488|nr:MULTISPECIES: amidohydrolase family protein [Actinoplanes]GLY00445.1 hypothetical protein Acsp01_08240 [Actinoplanes sp. NBRC 101535]
MAQRIFDFHARLAPAPGALDRLTTALDAAGISRAALCAGGTITVERLSRQLVVGGHLTTDADNAAVIAACRGSGGRFTPFWFANPHRPAVVYEQAAGDVRGLEISPAVHGVPLTDDRIDDLVRVADAAGHPVYTVCLIRDGCGVRDLATLAARFPDTTFVLGHSGTGQLDVDAIEVIAPRDNILFETSGGYSVVLATALRRLGAGRLLFGTEFPLQHPEVELAKVRAVGPAPHEWTAIAWDNAHRVLGLEVPDAIDHL